MKRADLSQLVNIWAIAIKTFDRTELINALLQKYTNYKTTNKEVIFNSIKNLERYNFSYINDTAPLHEEGYLQSCTDELIEVLNIWIKNNKIN
jgi:hypothetical protein